MGLAESIRLHKTWPIHALVAIKRSGWVLGVQLSDILRTPVFSLSEIASIPARLSRIAVIDTVHWTGRSFARHIRALRKASIEPCLAAALFSKTRPEDVEGVPFLPGARALLIPRFQFHRQFRLDREREARFLEFASRLRALQEHASPST
ncbi:MAG: hypothetical protein HRF49_09490 [bacterium]